MLGIVLIVWNLMVLMIGLSVYEEESGRRPSWSFIDHPAGM